MGILNFFKNIFRREELSEEDMKKINPDYKIEETEKVSPELIEEFEFKDIEPTLKTEEKASEYDNLKDIKFKELKINQKEIKNDDEIIEEDIKETKIEMPKIDLTVDEMALLGNIKIDLEDLALKKLESESETVNTYLKMLMKDISAYQNNKNDKIKQDLNGKSISTKVKKITMHSLEIKNLLSIIETHYFEVLLAPLKKINEKYKNDKLNEFIKPLENNFELIKKIETQLTKIIAYDELLNPEKNKNFNMAIESEVTKGKVHHDISELYSILSQSLSKTLGIKSSIEKSKILEYINNLV